MYHAPNWHTCRSTSFGIEISTALYPGTVTTHNWYLPDENFFGSDSATFEITKDLDGTTRGALESQPDHWNNLNTLTTDNCATDPSHAAGTVATTATETPTSTAFSSPDSHAWSSLATPDTVFSNLSTPVLPVDHDVDFFPDLIDQQQFDDLLKLGNGLDLLAPHLLSIDPLVTIPAPLPPLSVAHEAPSPLPSLAQAPVGGRTQPAVIPLSPASPVHTPGSTASSRKRKYQSASPRPQKELVPTEISPDDDEKVVKRKRNTEAARRYRQKKQDRMQELEERVDEVEEENRRLREELMRKDLEAEKWKALWEMSQRK